MKKISLLTLIIATSLILTGCGKQVDPNEGGKLDSFAQCMTDKGLKMYGTDWCPHCQKMKAMFGTAFSKINFVNCDTQKVQCDVAKIEGYPTWIFNGTSYQGEKTIAELSKLTSCVDPTTSTTGTGQ